MKKLTAAVCAGLIIVAGCAAPNEYGKPAPTTVAGCESDYFAAQQRIRQARRNNTTPGLAGVIGTAIGAGLSESVYNRRYRECLASVGVENAAVAPLPRLRAEARPQVRARKAEARPSLSGTIPRPAVCPRGYSGMYRGTLYC